MIGQGKLIGGALIGLGVIIAAVLTLWAFSNQGSEGGLTGGSVALVSGCGIVLGVILAGAGVFFFMSGRTETAQYADVAKEKGVLNAVSTQGQVQIGQLALEQNLTIDQIKKIIYDLVGKGLFTGYVDWKGQKLFSEDAAALNQQIASTGKCPDCGAPLTLGGKGVVTCQYCGAEFFIPPSVQSSAPGAGGSTPPGAGASGGTPAPTAS